MDMWQACKDGDLEYVRRYIDSGNDLDDVRDIYGYTALMEASEHENGNIVELILNWGVDIEAQDNRGETALMVASEHGRKNIVELLLDRNTNIEARDKYGWTALIWASRNGHRDIAKLLLSRGADIKTQDNEGYTAFMHALQDGQIFVAQYFAQIMIPNPDISYSDVPVSSFIPRHERIGAQKYVGFVRELIPIYLERAVKDSQFGIDTQRNIKEILDGKTDENREPLTKKDKAFLMKLLKTLHSIDYTERDTKSSQRDYPAIDMEL